MTRCEAPSADQRDTHVAAAQPQTTRTIPRVAPIASRLRDGMKNGINILVDAAVSSQTA